MDSSSPERFRDCIVRAKAGDSEAFGELYREWYSPVFRFILLRVSSREVAEDLVQDVFLKLFNHLDRFELRAAHPLGFLYTTARNTVIDYRKKKKTERFEEGGEDLIADEGEPNPEEASSRRIAVDDLRKALPQLTDEQRLVVELRFLEEYSVKETAEIVGKSEEAVRQLSVRALRTLRTVLNKRDNIHLP